MLIVMNLMEYFDFIYAELPPVWLEISTAYGKTSANNPNNHETSLAATSSSASANSDFLSSRNLTDFLLPSLAIQDDRLLSAVNCAVGNILSLLSLNTGIAAFTSTLSSLPITSFPNGGEF